MTKSMWMCWCTSFRTNKVEGRPFTRTASHQNCLFLVKRVDPDQDHQTAASSFEVASTQIGCEVLHREMTEESSTPIEVQAQAASLLDVNAQDAQVSKLCKVMTGAGKVLGTIFTGYGFPKE